MIHESTLCTLRVWLCLRRVIMCRNDSERSFYASWWVWQAFSESSNGVLASLSDFWKWLNECSTNYYEAVWVLRSSGAIWAKRALQPESEYPSVESQLVFTVSTSLSESSLTLETVRQILTSLNESWRRSYGYFSIDILSSLILTLIGEGFRSHSLKLWRLNVSPFPTGRFPSHRKGDEYTEFQRFIK